MPPAKRPAIFRNSRISFMTYLLERLLLGLVAGLAAVEAGGAFAVVALAAELSLFHGRVLDDFLACGGPEDLEGPGVAARAVGAPRVDVRCVPERHDAGAIAAPGEGQVLREIREVGAVERHSSEEEERGDGDHLLHGFLLHVVRKWDLTISSHFSGSSSLAIPLTGAPPSWAVTIAGCIWGIIRWAAASRKRP